MLLSIGTMVSWKDRVAMEVLHESTENLYISTSERTFTPQTSLDLSSQGWKQHTVSDEMAVLQPSLEPVIMLKQYQVLSLGYSMKLTSSPYIHSVLCSHKTATEIHNNRRSYFPKS